MSTEPAGMVDDWGRDPGLVRTVMHLARLRWAVSVGGDQRLPRRKGGLIVVNTRRFALTPIFTALAVSEAVDRPVRFVGRPDTAPVGAFSRRIGGLLEHPDEVGGALAAGQLVVLGAVHGEREVGIVDHAIVGAAVAAGVSVYPAATSSSPLMRAARVEIGPASRSPRRRRGPLTELELADRVRLDISLLLDELGELHTGTPLDWFPLSGLGGA
ncbi:MAG TPA: hypothetical protein VK853_04910 [Ilumatobacteraceae bacterium]|nr:hypothetical protein [Ilumatobacteraceae bacterium]